MTPRVTAADRQRNSAKRIIAGMMWTALVVAPLLVGGLAFFFVVRAFSDGFGAGIRSFAAVVLPLMVLTFVVASKLSRRNRESDPSGWVATGPSGVDPSGSQVSAEQADV